jgi:hypothetical protein
MTTWYGPAVPVPEPSAVPGAVPGSPDASSGGSPERAEPPPAVDWDTVPYPGKDGGSGTEGGSRSPADGVVEQAARAASGTALGGGRGGLLAELRDPHPEGFREHWAHITTHPALPDDRLGAVAFSLGHAALTMPAKALGKLLRLLGWLLMHTGTRLDWAADRAARLLAVIVIAALIAGVVWYFA